MSLVETRRSMHVLNLSLQARSKVNLGDVAVLRECCPIGGESVIRIVLAFVSDSTSLSQVYVAFNVLWWR